MTSAIHQYRFGLGPVPQQSSEAGPDPRTQLAQPVAIPAAANLPSAAQGVELFLARQAAVRAARRDQTTASFITPIAVSEAELAARLQLAQTTAAPLHERLALHWANHFTVTRANYAGYLAGAMEREAIRPHILGRFEAMLRACTTHAAMLFYLNNRASIGPNAAAAGNGRRGLNENQARELLELHSLGVDGGYTQQDVQEVARILTGWTVRLEPGEAPAEGRIGFRPEWHEPGPRVVLGKRYPEGGAEQLDALLHDLARHPATARHVCRRLVRHFIGDQAPPALAETLAATFRETEGDLTAVTRALVSHPASWSTPAHKMRPPIELIFGAARLLGGLPQRPPLRRALGAMGQPWHGAGSPAGWPEEDNAWAAPDAVKTRLDWAQELATNLPPQTDARRLAEGPLSAALSAETRRAVQRAASGAQAMTLLLMSPELQRR